MSALPAGWLSEREADELRRLAVGIDVLELGAWKGRSTVALAETAASVVSIDAHKPFTHFGESFDEDSLPDYLDAVRPLPNVSMILGSFDVAKLFVGDAFELVFVDGLHDLASVTSDLEIALAFRCTIALHDYGLYEVKHACDQISLEPSWLVDHLAVFPKGLSRGICHGCRLNEALPTSNYCAGCLP